MPIKLEPTQQVIVAADFDPDPKEGPARIWAKKQTIELAKSFQGTGVTIKIESAISVWDSAVRDLHNLFFPVMLDLKAVGNSKTLARTAKHIRELGPQIVTVYCPGCKPAALEAFKAELPDVEVLGVTVLTSFNNTDSLTHHGCEVLEGVMRFADLAYRAKLDGIVCAPAEAKSVRRTYGDRLTINTPNIRLEGMAIPGDDQSLDRSGTPYEAILAGADRLIIGRSILMAQGKPYDALMRVVTEIIAARVKMAEMRVGQ
jgi:orotidine-5'-phosphate decarboxylase